MDKTIKNNNDIEFFGRISASVSHELNNILSIINEYSGLLGDLLYASEQGKPVDIERIKQISKNIEEQIKRQKSVIKLLNRFSHRADQEIMNFELYELINDITRLSRRIVLLKKVRLEADLPQVPTNITSSPFIIQHIIYRLIVLSLQFCKADDLILITTSKENSYESVKIEVPKISNEESTEKEIEIINSLAYKIDSKIELFSFDSNKDAFKIIIPVSIVELKDL